jgi:hypothetical protein
MVRVELRVSSGFLIAPSVIKDILARIHVIWALLLFKANIIPVSVFIPISQLV